MSGCGPDPAAEGGSDVDDITTQLDINAPELSAPPPADWTCDARFFGEGWCDCGCGTLDVDCGGIGLYDCVYNACRGNERPDPHQPTQCQFNFESCHPDYMWSTDLPRRYPWSERERRDKH